MPWQRSTAMRGPSSSSHRTSRGSTIAWRRARSADLAHGAQLAMAPATDGRPFLIALARADPAIVRAAADGLPDRQAAAGLIGGEFGLLRSERRLVTPGDARAFAADPLTPPGLAALLR